MGNSHAFPQNDTVGTGVLDGQLAIYTVSDRPEAGPYILSNRNL